MRSIVLVLALVGSTTAQESKPKPPKDLDGALRKLLDARKLLVTSTRWKQVFQPYVASDMPVFVTSDSVLNAYHVLFEASVLRLEKSRARVLPQTLRLLWNGIRPVRKELELPRDLVDRAEKIARTSLATALVLLGEAVPEGHAEIAETAALEAKRIEAARGQHKPSWLGPPDPSFRAWDYARFRPVGFYTRSERLQRYFRAIAFLQAIPLRIDRDHELLTHVLLRAAAQPERHLENEEADERALALLGGYAELLGPGHEPSISAELVVWSTPYDIDDLRREGDSIRAELPREPIADRIAERLVPVARILPSARLPDAVLFQRMTANRPGARPRPLAICAGLGSRWARATAGADLPKDGLTDMPGLYGDYLDTIALLLDEPEPDAPNLFGSVAWQRKSCNTALAGWAQLRHTWALQAKHQVHYLGMARCAPGFVEPEPEFFGSLGRLADRGRWLLAAAGAFGEDLALANLRDDLALAKSVLKEAPPDAPGWRKFLRAQDPARRWAVQRATLLAFLNDNHSAARRPHELAATASRAIEELDGDGPLRATLRKLALEGDFDLRAMWVELSEVCGRLESMAHKQLRGRDWNDAEQSFLQDYGKRLAGLMFYGGNSYLTPRDDAPRAVSVFSSPDGGHFHAATARARTLYVLYPWKGREVLCRGAVLPFLGFEHETPLTDAAWKKLLDSDDRPALPAWARPLYAPGTKR